MSPAIQRRLDAFRQQRRVQAGSLIISAFGDAILPRGGRIWIGSLIRLLEPLGLSERLVRTAVFRLVREEWLRTESRGRRSDYLLTPSGRQRCQEAARHIYAPDAPPWDQAWRLILAVGDFDPEELERLRRALFWQGFGRLGNHCFVHPGADPGTALEALAAEGLGGQIGRLLPLLAGRPEWGLWADDGDLVRRAWKLDDLGLAYDGFLATWAPVLGGLGEETTDEAAFLLRLLLIHDYRRLLLRDPELPGELLPADWPGDQARRLCGELYRRLMVPSERHLERFLQLADSSVPPAEAGLERRFRPEEATPAPV